MLNKRSVQPNTDISSNQRHDLRVWSNAHVVRAEAAVYSERTLLSDDLLEAVEHAAVRQFTVRTPLLLLQASLDKIERQTEERSEETGDRRRCECLGSWTETGVFQLTLSL